MSWFGYEISPKAQCVESLVLSWWCYCEVTGHQATNFISRISHWWTHGWTDHRPTYSEGDTEWGGVPCRVYPTSGPFLCLSLCFLSSMRWATLSPHASCHGFLPHHKKAQKQRSQVTMDKNHQNTGQNNNNPSPLSYLLRNFVATKKS